MLRFAGWIKDEGGVLSPNCDIRGVKAPLGWQPRPSRLTDLVVNGVVETAVPKDVKIANAPVLKRTEVIGSNDTDLRARMEKRLAKFISKQSGIELQEINRRAERKMKALRYCTMWSQYV